MNKYKLMKLKCMKRKKVKCKKKFKRCTLGIERSIFEKAHAIFHQVI